MGELWVRDAGSWKRVEDGTDFKYHNGTAFVNPTEVVVRDAGTWKQVWVKSDPVTYNFSVDGVDTLRRDGANMEWRELGYGYVGRFDTNSDSDNVTVWNIADSNFSTYYAARPVVTACTFTLKRDTSAGSASDTGTIYMGIYTGTFSSGTPSFNNLDFTPNDSENRTWAQGGTYTWNLGTTFGQTVANDFNNGNLVNMAMSIRTSGWDGSGSADAMYMRFQGPTTGYTGTLSITLDYS